MLPGIPSQMSLSLCVPVSVYLKYVFRSRSPGSILNVIPSKAVSQPGASAPKVAKKCTEDVLSGVDDEQELV